MKRVTFKTKTGKKLGLPVHFLPNFIPWYHENGKEKDSGGNYDMVPKAILTKEEKDDYVTNCMAVLCAWRDGK